MKVKLYPKEKAQILYEKVFEDRFNFQEKHEM